MDVPVGNIPFHCDETASVKRRIIQLLPGILLLALGSVPLVAQVSIPYQFQSGAPARASEVNENFEALRAALNIALSQINDLRDELRNELARIGELEEEIQALRGSNVFAMAEYVEVMPDPHVLNGTTIRFSGVNLQIVNGEGITESINGLGNIIVGYNEPHMVGETDKSGSHNFVGGSGNAYSSFGGLVVGVDNTITAPYASVSGGSRNTASGERSSVSGGSRNTASGEWSSVSGGSDNTAFGQWSSVSGGDSNMASGGNSSVSGGFRNTGSGEWSSVSGGRRNTASGDYSSILGGLFVEVVNRDGISPPTP
ncbi:hypothetical protein [Thioalkalivibrio sulfidiphilus]|uniref:hypothetical protein n=1 Tax=Thioalkalivibrio sulfidiphilus TaxID=1033854 RepID=UPI003BB0BDF4